jgi:sulfonate transport system substrate-binding protein
MRRFERVLVGLALFASVLGVPLASHADAVKLRIAWIVPAGDAPLALLRRPGIAQHEGKSYTLEFTHFTGTPTMITALAASEVDMASLGFSSFALAIENAKLEDLRILGDTVQDGTEGFYSNEFMVLNDGPIKKVEDLKGKVVSSNAVGGAVDIVLRAMLRRHGLEDKRDYSLIEAAFPNMRSMLADHKADLVTVVPPFSYDPTLRAAAHPLFVQKDVMGKTQLLVMTSRAGFVAKNRAALVDFLEDNLRELRWYRDPANHDEAVKTVSDFTKTPAAVWSSWFFTKGDVYHDPQGQPDLVALRRNIATAHELGFVAADLDPKKYADLSLVDEAAKRLH